MHENPSRKRNLKKKTFVDTQKNSEEKNVLPLSPFQGNKNDSTRCSEGGAAPEEFEHRSQCGDRLEIRIYLKRKLRLDSQDEN